MLVQIEANQRAEFFLLCLERLLRYTQSKRLLVLTSASSRPTLEDVWLTATSREDGQLLMKQFPTRYSLIQPLDGKIRVCIATVRELQLEQIEQHQHLSTSFDTILVYDFPAHLSPVWRRVIERQQVHYLIALCESPKQEVIQWFEGTIIGGVPEEGTSHHNCTQRTTMI